MRGYTGYGRDSLFIKDPGTHELIVDRDKNYPNRLVYNYNTPQAPTGMTWVAEIVAAVSVSPKDRLVTEGIVDIFEYDNPPVVITPSPLADPYWTDYIDYVSIGIDSHGILDPLDPGMGHIGNIEIMDPATMNGYLLTYDDTGLTEIIHVDDGVPTPYIDDEFMFKTRHGVCPIRDESRSPRSNGTVPQSARSSATWMWTRRLFSALGRARPRKWNWRFEGIITPQSLGFEGPGEEPFAIPWTGDETVTLPFEVLPEPDPAEIAEMEFWENFIPIPGDLNEDGYVGSADLDNGSVPLGRVRHAGRYLRRRRQR